MHNINQIMQFRSKLFIENGEINDNRLTFIANLSGSFGSTSWTSNEGYNFGAKTVSCLI